MTDVSTDAATSFPRELDGLLYTLGLDDQHLYYSKIRRRLAARHGDDQASRWVRARMLNDAGEHRRAVAHGTGCTRWWAS